MTPLIDDYTLKLRREKFWRLAVLKAQFECGYYLGRFSYSVDYDVDFLTSEKYRKMANYSYNRWITAKDKLINSRY